MSFDSGVDQPEEDTANTPKKPLAIGFWDFSGPYSNVYMFTDGDVVACVVELAVGIYTHFCIGSITKTETFTGGDFIAGMASSRTTGLHRRIGEGGCNGLFPGVELAIGIKHGGVNRGVGTSSPFGYGSKIYAVPLSGANTQYNRFATFSEYSDNNNASGESQSGINVWSFRTTSPTTTFHVGANSANQRTPLWPNIIRLLNQNNNQWRISGHTPLIKFCFIDHLQPGDIIFDDWQVFPLSQYNGDRTQAPDSQNIGVAYKRT